MLQGLGLLNLLYTNYPRAKGHFRDKPVKMWLQAGSITVTITLKFTLN